MASTDDLSPAAVEPDDSPAAPASGTALLLDALAELVHRLKALERITVDLQLKVAALEGRPLGLHWVGVYDPARSYRADEAVTHDGQIWLCTTPCRGRKPGYTGDGTWRLVVQRGREGRCRCK